MTEKDYLREGLALINKGDLEGAEAILKEGLSKEPDDEKLLNLMGWVLYQREKYEEMIEVYKNLVKKNPQQSFSLFYNLGRAYFNLKEYRSAIDAFNKTLELAPNHKSAMFYLSASYEKIGDLKSSKKVLAKLVEHGKLNEEVKDVSIQEGLSEYNVDYFLETFRQNFDVKTELYKKSSLFGVWSINTDFISVWSEKFEIENFIEHVVLKGEGRIIFKEEPFILILSEKDEILVNAEHLVGIDNIFECAFNRASLIKIKGPRKVILQKRRFFIEDIEEKDVIRKEGLVGLIGQLKVKEVENGLLTIKKGTGKVILF